MTSGRRWSVVGVGIALLVAIPLGVRAVPPSSSDISAADLLARIEASTAQPFSGYAESLGTLQLPVTDRFEDLGDLFGGRTRMRVWWQSADRWRVDKLLATGEIDTYHQPGGLTTWDYERNEVTIASDPTIRLPRAADLLPPQLAYRLLDQAQTDEVSRLPSARVAGQSAPGLRLVPSDPRSSIAHIDVWADEQTGLPLRVRVYGDGDSTAAVSSEFMSFSASRPSDQLLTVPSPPDADYRHDGFIDIADASNQFAPLTAPQSLVGLERSTATRLLGVGVYGRGVTRLIAIQLWDDAAEPLRRQLSLTPGSRRAAGGVLLDVGPLHLLLTESRGGGGWLVSGTVTDRTLVRAATALQSRPVVGR
jgi:MucB/RseB N-terminal domain